MAIFYADTSVLTKTYLPERGSEWVRAIADTSSSNTFFTAYMTQIEGMSAFNRRLREGTLSPVEYAVIIEDWLLACAVEYHLVPVSPQTVVICQRLLESYPLRAYDAVQLASAVISNETLVAAGDAPLVFLASDRRLLDAARSEGFEVNDPNLHP